MNDRDSQTLKNMFAGYGALVMATGIVSTACKRLHYDELAIALFWLNNAYFLVLLLVTAVRIAKFPSAVYTSLTDQRTGAGYFTYTAAACVLGVQHTWWGSPPIVPVALWIFGLAVWMCVNYSFFTSVVTRKERIPSEDPISGAWLTAVVALQGLSILLGEAGGGAQMDDAHFFVSLSFCGAGAMLYLMLIAVIFYRLVCLPVQPKDMSAPYWVGMGATAITCLAFTKLSMAAPADFVGSLRGMAVVYWGFGTWWIPMLFLVGFWRHFTEKVPLTYHPSYWSMVFPMGMYVVATDTLGEAWQWQGFRNVASVAVFIAITAWAVTTIGLYRVSLSWLRARRL